MAKKRGKEQPGVLLPRPGGASLDPAPAAALSVRQAGAVGGGTERGGESFNLGHYFLFFLLIVVLAACLHVLAAYGHTIILASLLAIVFAPVHRRFLPLTGGRENLAAILSCLGLTLVVVLPLLFVFLSLIGQGVDSFNAIHAWINAGEPEKLLNSPLGGKVLAAIAPYFTEIEKFFHQAGGEARSVNSTILDLTSQVGKFLISQGGGLVGNFSAFVGKFFLLLFTFFFVIRDEEKIFRYLLHLIPLHASHEDKIINKIKAVSSSVLLGTFLTAVAQGAAGGLAFWFAGLPALFWGAMMAFAALIPFVGTALIWLPAALYLLLLGRWGAAIGMVLWCALVVGLLDNLIRPLFMKGSADMSPLLVFFAILGGVNTFGLIGLLYGPLLFGLAIVLLYIYEIEFSQFLRHQDQS